MISYIERGVFPGDELLQRIRDDLNMQKLWYVFSSMIIGMSASKRKDYSTGD